MRKKYDFYSDYKSELDSFLAVINNKKQLEAQEKAREDEIRRKAEEQERIKRARELFIINKEVGIKKIIDWANKNKLSKIGGVSKSMLTLDIPIINVKEQHIKGLKMVIELFRETTSFSKSSS